MRGHIPRVSMLGGAEAPPASVGTVLRVGWALLCSSPLYCALVLAVVVWESTLKLWRRVCCRVASLGPEVAWDRLDRNKLPRHVAVVGTAAAALDRLSRLLFEAGVQRVTAYDPRRLEASCVRHGRAGQTLVWIGAGAHGRAAIPAMARTGGSWHDLGPGYDDEPDLLLTLDGSLHGYPPTMLRVTHLHHLQNCTRRAVRAALVQYVSTERRSGC
ncbi:hypothetical protein CDCA_CDCA11G3235 [Cyanidium caldarium]|uniref:Uncharacterized protein n=1 Tax=Cyanidium caldarium TaxID=2771 RepID=A0AAV9IYP3_CYACA|nr:hypothetical protein CDCA_CDCA11G3235 [Cyanidium caldarium]